MKTVNTPVPGRPMPEAAQYFAPHPIKFIVMVTCTFGLYELYWSYRNWKFVKQRDDSDIRPFWRALFFPLTFYYLLEDLNKSFDSRVFANAGIRGFLAMSIIVLSFTWRLPDPYWLISLFAFVPFLPVVVAMRAHENAAPEQKSTKSFHPANLLAYFIGGPSIAVVVLGAIGFIPGAVVITGDKLWDRDIAYLRSAEILGADETIEYFYSEGSFSISEGGQFISRDYVTTYWQNFETGETVAYFTAYPDITGIDVDWSESFFDKTVVTVTTTDGTQFDLWLSPEAGGDRTFVDAMNLNWDKARESLALRNAKSEEAPTDQAGLARRDREAAERGHVSAQFNIALRYVKGDGLPQDYSEAAKWYRKAAERGHVSAQNNLGGMYLRGEGVPQDHAEAMKWFRQAAEQGHASAQYELSFGYYHGQGLPQSYVESYAWSSVAAASGHAEAKFELVDIAEKLSPSELDAAQNRAERFLEEIQRGKE